MKTIFSKQYHEALHVASVANDFVDRNLCEHPAIQQDPEWAAQAKQASQALFDLYQMIGASRSITEDVIVLCDGGHAERQLVARLNFDPEEVATWTTREFFYRVRAWPLC